MNVRAAVSGSVPKLYQNGRHDEVGNFTDADRQLMNIEIYLRHFVDYITPQKNESEDNNSNQKPTSIKPKIDYDSCKVDDTKPYSLDAVFSKKRPVAFIFEGKRYDVQSWKRFLVMVCELLNQKDSKLFQSFPEDESMQGRTRKYFIRNSSQYHKKVAGTGIWVLTNNDGSANCRTIIKMFEKYDIPITSMEIYIQTDYSLRNEDEENGADENVKKLDTKYVNKEIIRSTNPNKYIKIGEYAREYFTKYFTNVRKHYELKNFLNKYWCHDNFGICYPLLKEVDITIPISKQKGYNNDYARYWVKPILNINDKYYIICSEWYPQFREKLDRWIHQQNSKTGVYVLPKPMRRTCPKCGQELIQNPLFVTYYSDTEDVNNKLPTHICNNCNTYYLSEGVFGSYTRSKDIENINVNFIKQDT